MLKLIARVREHPMSIMATRADQLTCSQSQICSEGFNGAALAKALFDAYCKERRAAAGVSRERDQLQQQVCT